MSTLLERLAANLTPTIKVEREIGAGGMATVFVAHDVKHDRRVAVKVLREELGASVGKERFLREVRVAANLQHPHVVPLFDSGEVDGLLYYVMPYIEGDSLRERLRSGGPPPLAEAIRILRDVADALAEAHRHGIVHRDLKPENIMLRGRHALVMDFGIAKALTEAAEAQSLTTAGIALGTPAYMAPEQILADPCVDRRADIYAFGVVAYELLAGRPPFAGSTPQQTLAAHLTVPPEPLTQYRDVPAPIAALVMKCLEKNPDDRWQRADDLIEHLEGVPTTGADGVGALSLPDPHRRYPWVRPMLPYAVGAILVAAAVLSAKPLRNRALARAPAPSRVAVLTFSTAGADTSASYLAAGLADGIATALGQATQLTIVSRTAVRGIGEPVGITPAQLGERLGATHLVSGSVQHVGSRLLVNVELVQSASGDEIWSARYDTTSSSILGMPETIAQKIAGRLISNEPEKLGTRPTTDPEAYDHYLRGNRLLWTESQGSVLAAIAEYEQALRRDPAFSSAMGRLSYAYGVSSNWAYRPGGLSSDSVLARGLSLADRAIQLDPANSDAWLGRGLAFFYRGEREDLPNAVRAVQRAVTLDSANDAAYHSLAVLARRMGRFDEAEQEYHRALAINPSRIQSQGDLGFIAMSRRSYAVAVQMYDKAVGIDSNVASSYGLRAIARVGLRDHAGAVRDVERGVELSTELERPRNLALLAFAEARAGDRTRARAHLQEALRGARLSAPALPHAISVRDAWQYALAATALDDEPLALALLERARPRGPWLWSYLIFEGFDPLRANPRFRRIIDEARPEGVTDPGPGSD